MQETGIELVATNDVHYTMQRMQSLMTSCSAFRPEKISWHEDRMRYEGGQYYVKSEENEITFSICTAGVGEHAEDCRPMSC